MGSALMRNRVSCAMKVLNTQEKAIIINRWPQCGSNTYCQNQNLEF